MIREACVVSAHPSTVRAELSQQNDDDGGTGSFGGVSADRCSLLRPTRMASALRRIRDLQVEGDVLVWLIRMPNSYSNLPPLRLVQCRLLLFVNPDL